MQLDIYVRETSGNREIRIPILPESIMFKRGETAFLSYDIMDLGEVAAPSGTGLASISWESVFPGELSPEVPMVRGKWNTPESYDKTLAEWQAKGSKLNVLVTGYPTFNKDVYIETYEGQLSGAFGDIVYQLSFIEARDIVINTTKVEASSTATQSSSTKRSAATGKSYTIKSGDTLWAIAVKFYGDGTKWKAIYDANKDIIEQTAKKYGRSSSDNGRWIYPGVTLTIPDISSAKGSTASTQNATYNKNYTASREAGTTGLVKGLAQNQNYVRQ